MGGLSLGRVRAVNRRGMISGPDRRRESDKASDQLFDVLVTEDSHDFNRTVGDPEINAVNTAYTASVARANFINGGVPVRVFGEFIKTFEKRIEVLTRLNFAKLKNTATVNAQ
jgi:hypothetical protein